jgi:hypothetical protein
MAIEEKTLLHIGYHKTGTTWLQNYVFSSRELGFVAPMPAKEMMDLIVLPNALDFSPDVAEAEIIQFLQRPENDDLLPVFSNERFSGHPHSGGYDSRTIADRLRALFADARILICIREQKKVILSCYNQYIKKGGAISISSYLNVSDRTRVPLFDFRHFMYHRLISYYQQIFGRDRVLVLPYELFIQDGSDYVSRIVEFANQQPRPVSPDVLPAQNWSNRSITGFELEVRRLMNFTVGYRNSINQFSLRPVNKKHTDSLFEQVQKLRLIVPASLSRAIMTSLETKASRLVGSRYCESNRITSELTGIDLSRLGYQT